jgi:hypothetical protein
LRKINRLRIESENQRQQRFWALMGMNHITRLEKNQASSGCQSAYWSTATDLETGIDCIINCRYENDIENNRPAAHKPMGEAFEPWSPMTFYDRFELLVAVVPSLIATLVISMARLQLIVRVVVSVIGIRPTPRAKNAGRSHDYLQPSEPTRTRHQ